MRKKGRKSLWAGILIVWMSCQSVWADTGEGQLLTYDTKEDSLIFYLQNPGENYEIQCQIGTSAAEKLESYKIEEEEVPIETIMLLDNSLSVTENYHAMIQQIMTDLVANRMNGEKFTIALFSDKLQYLIQGSSDYAQLKQTIDEISYQDQETYLTDVLYELFVELNAENSKSLKRIVILSDGMDNKAIGYTKEELYELVKKKSYPIYALGCSYKDNQEALKNMFALSRMTGGNGFLLDEISDSMDAVNQITQTNQAIKVVVIPKERDCDGSRKAVKLTVLSEGAATVNTVEMDMPFRVIEEKEDIAESIEETNIQVTEETAEQKTNVLVPILLASGAGIGLAGFVLWLILKRKRENEFVSAGREEKAFSPVTSSHETRLLDASAGAGKKETTDTVMIWENQQTYHLMLQDLEHPVHHYEVSLDHPVLIGYSDRCQICLNYEETVSREHCIIYQENGEFYVENKSRTNGTILNGKKMMNREKIYSGCLLKLGKLTMKVEIR